MDSKQAVASRERWQARRLSQDVPQLQATLAARSGRQRPRFSRTATGRSAVSPLPEMIVEEPGLRREAPNMAYQSFLARLRDDLIHSKDPQGNPLWASQQIQAQLETCNTDVPPDSLDRSFGERGGLMYFGKGVGGMEHLHMDVSVESLTSNNTGFIEMDEKWKSTADTAEASFRWIHLPANNPEWARHAMVQIFGHFMVPEHDDDNPVCRLVSPSHLEEQVLRPELFDAQQNVGPPESPHARFMRPFARKIDASVATPHHTVGGSLSRHLSRHESIGSGAQLERPIQEVLARSLVFYLPFLHWDTTLAYAHMSSVIRDVDGGGIGSFASSDIAGLPCGTDEKLLRHHLQRLQPLHVRRSLDQFGYFTIADTTSRDKDQVVDRYTRTHGTTGLGSPPMLMVDNLWLWLLGDHTILTCFPHRWNKTAATDSTDVYEAILELLDDPLHRSKVTDGGKLAALIMDRCAGNILDRALLKDEHLRFMDFFDWSIDDLNERQSQCLQALWTDVQNSTDTETSEGLTNIAQEFDILEKIKDIIDELQIILKLIDQQLLALAMILHDDTDILAPSDDRESDGAVTPSRPSHAEPQKVTDYVEFERLQEHARDRADGIKSMIERATATYDATLDVLSLKQQQAGISEARSQRKAAQELEKMAKESKKAAAESEKQSYSIMLFTIVTIFFLPLSAIASIFGINAIEFGQGTVHLRTIFAYLVPISLVIVYVSLKLAFDHKTRRNLVLLMQISRAYINLVLPVVFDEHKESRLKAKLEELKQRRKRQKERKMAKMLANRTKKEHADDDEQVDDGPHPGRRMDIPDDDDKEDDIFHSHDVPNGKHGTVRLNSIAGASASAFRWNRLKSVQRRGDSEAGITSLAA